MLEVGNVKYPIWVSEVASPPAQFKETRTRIIKQNSGKVESSSSSSTASSNQCSKLKSQLEDSGEALETVNEQQSGGNFEALGKSKEGSKDISEEANIKDNGDKIYNGEEEICLQKSISLSQVRGKSKKNKELIDNSGPGPEPKGGGSNEPSNHKRDLNPRGVDEVSFSDGEGATRRSGKSKDTNSERARLSVWCKAVIDFQVLTGVLFGERVVGEKSVLAQFYRERLPLRGELDEALRDKGSGAYFSLIVAVLFQFIFDRFVLER
ncbi:hypothetical protein V6N11_060887 [Hibiscus sabdariffa]|uniref:Uncharacterized protein n=1 Tax=Hibiscus sabdariffa TaxID=183260 RepID=A0ABR2QRQ5_9ROSI